MPKRRTKKSLSRNRISKKNLRGQRKISRSRSRRKVAKNRIKHKSILKGGTEPDYFTNISKLIQELQEFTGITLDTAGKLIFGDFGNRDDLRLEITHVNNLGEQPARYTHPVLTFQKTQIHPITFQITEIYDLSSLLAAPSTSPVYKLKIKGTTNISRTLIQNENFNIDRIIEYHEPTFHRYGSPPQYYLKFTVSCYGSENENIYGSKLKRCGFQFIQPENYFLRDGLIKKVTMKNPGTEVIFDDDATPENKIKNEEVIKGKYEKTELTKIIQSEGAYFDFRTYIDNPPHGSGRRMLRKKKAPVYGSVDIEVESVLYLQVSNSLPKEVFIKRVPNRDEEYFNTYGPNPATVQYFTDTDFLGYDSSDFPEFESYKITMEDNNSSMVFE